MIRLYPRPASRRKNIGFTGQSNVVGGDSVANLPSFSHAHKVFNYTNAGTWQNPASEPIDNGSGQVDAVSYDAAAGASPALSFASELARLRGCEIGLVPCAKGGSSMAQWMPNSLSRSTLWGSFIARMKESATQGDLAGVIMYQGETDAETSAAANSWAANFLTFANATTEELGVPDIKFIVTELGPVGPAQVNDLPYWSTVQSQQRSLDGALGGRIRCVSATGLSVYDNGVHLSALSQVVLGKRYAPVMNDLLG